jgi:hypothetical protein
MNQGTWWTPKTLRKEDTTHFVMNGRTVSIKVYSLCLLLQVTSALNYARMHQQIKFVINMINKIYAKEILKPSFYWYRWKSHKLRTTTRISNLLYSLGYVSINILQAWINLSYACSWFSMNLRTQTKPPLQLQKRNETSAKKRIYNRSIRS